MTSAMTWLDQSVEQQRRVRELVNLFSETESRDELGIGQIRDVFSDALFPGVSVIQTRARYFLFVPWLFEATSRRASGATLLRRVHNQERRLIETLRDVEAVDGLIGRQAGAQLKILPSTIYWYGLGRWQILAADLAADQMGMSGSAAEDVTDELAGRALGDWSSTLPPIPPRFPDEVPGGFALLPEEASWLRERILTSVPESLLAHMVASPMATDVEAEAPWEDPRTTSLPDEVAAWLHDARLFSLTLHGAALLYNLLLAEVYEAAGLDGIEAPLGHYRAELDEWQERIEADRRDLEEWDRAAMRARVLGRNPRVRPPTWAFVEAWSEMVIDQGAQQVADSTAARGLVADRERLQKRRQARLTNQKLLTTWSGAAGARPLLYRWGTAQTVVADIAEGLEGHDARS